MEQLWDIGVKVIEIFMLFLGIIGLGLSLLLLFSPDLIRSAGRWFDRYINLDGKMACLNRYVRTDGLIYHHPVVFGLAMIVGSLFVLIFLFFYLPKVMYHDIVFEMAVSSLVWIGKIGSVAGILSGLGLMFFPEKMCAVESKMNAWFDLQPYIDKLNEPHRFVERLLFRHSVIFGMTGTMASALLILISVIGLSGRP